MKLKLYVALLLVLLILAGCGALDNDVLNNDTPSMEPAQSIPQASQGATLTPTPEFQPYIHVYETTV